jgi:hypothetical protein
MPDQAKLIVVPPGFAKSAMTSLGIMKAHLFGHSTAELSRTLVQWASAMVIEIDAKKVLLEKPLLVRGDNDEA